MEDTLIYQVTDEHEDLIIAARSEVETKKKILTVRIQMWIFNFYWSTQIKI